MKSLNQYIIEKILINKGSKFINNKIKENIIQKELKDKISKSIDEYNSYIEKLELSMTSFFSQRKRKCLMTNQCKVLMLRHTWELTMLKQP